MNKVKSLHVELFVRVFGEMHGRSYYIWVKPLLGDDLKVKDYEKPEIKIHKRMFEIEKKIGRAEFGNMKLKQIVDKGLYSLIDEL